MALGYRDPPPPPEATLWYGPFPFRIWPALILLAISFVLMLIAIDEDRHALRSLECTRPGRCVVRRGSDFWGVRDAETFDSERIVRAQGRRKGGKNPSYSLFLVDDRGQDIRLTGGSEAEALLPAIEPFFSDWSRTTLSVHRDRNLGDQIFFATGVTGTLLAALVLFARAARRAGRYRVSIEPQQVRVERMVLGVPRFPRSVPIERIHAVHIELGPGGTARVVLGTREGSDFAIVQRFMPGGIVHGELADRLRDELRLTP